MSKKETAKSQTSTTQRKKAKTLKDKKSQKVKAPVKPVEDLKTKAKKVKEERNIKQERFCQLYATDREFFGNGVETYLEVYGADKSKPNWYKTARAAASRLLSNVNIYTRINELLDGNGLNDIFVDKQLLMLIQQQEDKRSKIAAIKEYNKLKKRIVEKMELYGKNGEPLVIQTIDYSKAETKS